MVTGLDLSAPRARNSALMQARWKMDRRQMDHYLLLA
jgi:hypothetical protein